MALEYIEKNILNKLENIYLKDSNFYFQRDSKDFEKTTPECKLQLSKLITDLEQNRGSVMTNLFDPQNIDMDNRHQFALLQPFTKE